MSDLSTPPYDTPLGKNLWHRSQERLKAYAYFCYRRDLGAWVKAGRSPRTFRFCPDQFHRDWVEALGEGDLDRLKGFLINPTAHPYYREEEV